jgi:hypothetical protein
MDKAALFVVIVVVITRGILLHVVVLCGCRWILQVTKKPILDVLEVLDNGALFKAAAGLLVGAVS